MVVNGWINNECAECSPPHLNISDCFTRSHPSKGEIAQEIAANSLVWTGLKSTSHESSRLNYVTAKRGRSLAVWTISHDRFSPHGLTRRIPQQKLHAHESFQRSQSYDLARQSASWKVLVCGLLCTTSLIKVLVINDPCDYPNRKRKPLKAK
jgi:hypothetical protein